MADLSNALPSNRILVYDQRARDGHGRVPLSGYEPVIDATPDEETGDG